MTDWSCLFSVGNFCAILSNGKEVFGMTTRIFYHKVTGTPVQIIARAQTKPTYQDVICYQELTEPYEHYVMEKRQFFAEYVKDFAELPMTEKTSIGKKEDLPDKQPRISRGEVLRTEDMEEEEQQEERSEEDSKIEKLLAFLDAEDYTQKIKCLERMRDDLDEHMLNNIAVSLDMTLENGADSYQMIMSELRLRERYESNRGERL